MDFNQKAAEIARIADAAVMTKANLDVPTLAAALERIAATPDMEKPYDPTFKASAFSDVTKLLNAAAREGSMRFEPLAGILVASFEDKTDRSYMRMSVDVIRRENGLVLEHS